MNHCLAILLLCGAAFLPLLGATPPPLPALVSAPVSKLVSVVIASQIIGNTNFQYWGLLRSSNYNSLQVVNLTNSPPTPASRVLVSWDDPQTVLTSPDLVNWSATPLTATRTITLPLAPGQFFRVPIAAQIVSDHWDPSPSPQVIGYKFYLGTNSGSYFTALDVGTNLSVTLTNIQPGNAYYCVVTGYDGTGVESAPSNEVSYSVPLNTQPRITAR